MCELFCRYSFFPIVRNWSWVDDGNYRCHLRCSFTTLQLSVDRTAFEYSRVWPADSMFGQVARSSVSCWRLARWSFFFSTWMISTVLHCSDSFLLFHVTTLAQHTTKGTKSLDFSKRTLEQEPWFILAFLWAASPSMHHLSSLWFRQDIVFFLVQQDTETCGELFAFQQDTQPPKLFPPFSKTERPVDLFFFSFFSKTQTLEAFFAIFSKTHNHRKALSSFLSKTERPIDLFFILRQDTDLGSLFRYFQQYNQPPKLFPPFFRKTERPAYFFRSSARHRPLKPFSLFSAIQSTAETFSAVFQKDRETCLFFSFFSKTQTFEAFFAIFSNTSNRRNFSAVFHQDGERTYRFFPFFSKTQTLDEAFFAIFSKTHNRRNFSAVFQQYRETCRFFSTLQQDTDLWSLFCDFQQYNQPTKLFRRSPQQWRPQYLLFSGRQRIVGDYSFSSKTSLCLLFAPRMESFQRHVELHFGCDFIFRWFPLF